MAVLLPQYSGITTLGMCGLACFLLCGGSEYHIGKILDEDSNEVFGRSVCVHVKYDFVVGLLVWYQEKMVNDGRNERKHDRDGISVAEIISSMP